MYWFRDTPLQMVLWLGIAALWGMGGWLITTKTFKLEKGENLFIGFGVGLGMYLWLTNLLGHWVNPDITFIGAGVLVFLAGLLVWLREKEKIQWVEKFDLRLAWPLFLFTFILTWIFLRISEGVGMFDEFTHLPLISTLAAGDIPPRFFVNSDLPFAYHYGFQLLGASLMRLGGLFPWSAFDVSKAMLWGYAVVLAWVVGRRFGHPQARWFAALALVFASGTRYLLLLLPRIFLLRADSLLTFQGTEAGTAFSRWMIRIWEVEGAPPIGIPYAFLSGITEPLAIAHAGLHILHVIILLLVWLLAERISARGTAIGVLTILFSLWALTWESSYVLFLAGGFFAAVYTVWAGFRASRNQNEPFDFKKTIRTTHPAVFALLLSIPIALLQGGLLTELVRGIFTSTSGGEVASGLSLRWPPAILSKHLGPMSLFSPITLLIAIFEVGLILFFLPWISQWGWQKFKAGEWIWGALLLSAWAGFLIPVFINHRVSSDLSRVAAHGMLIFILCFSLQLSEKTLPTRFQTLGYMSLALMMVGGGVLFFSALTASSRPMIAAKLDELDALIAKDVWDQLPQDAEVFDPNSWHATALTGRLTHSMEGDYLVGVQIYPGWERLAKSPSIAGFLGENFSFIYINEKWWGNIPEESRMNLEADCIVVVSEHWSTERDRFRRLLDLRGCG